MNSKEVVKPNFNSEFIKNFNLTKRLDSTQRMQHNFRIVKDIMFSDDIWDFNYLNINNRANLHYIYKFDGIPSPYVFYVKMVLLNELLMNNKFRTLRNIFDKLKTITRYFYNNKIKDIRLINKEAVIQFIEGKSRVCKESHIEHLCIMLKKLLCVFQEIDNYSCENILLYLDEIAKKCRGNSINTSKHNYIPDAFLNQIVALALQDIDNEGLNKNARIVACLLIILAETGMRVEELSLLETNRLKRIIVQEKEVCYLEFLTFKTIKYEEAFTTYTWLSEKALKAYKVCENIVSSIIDGFSVQKLIKLYNSSQIENSSSNFKLSNSTLDQEKLKGKVKKYLFISAVQGTQKKGGALLRENIEKFFVRHADDFDIEKVPVKERENIKILTIKSEAKYKKFFMVAQRKKKSFEEIKNKKFLYVNPHMFRVTVCTKLFRQGVHLDFIVKHMNHLSEDMTMYYNKSQEFIDKLEESMVILSSITDDNGLIQTDTNQIQDEFLKKELSNEAINGYIKRMNDFFEKNKLNIKDNLSEIITLLRNFESPIAENDFGVCIRTVVHGVCERRKYFSTMNDNYFIRMPLDTFKFIHYSYERFQQKSQIIKHNYEIAKQDKRYELEYQRETKALRVFLKRNLCNEIRLLEKEIEKSSVEYVMAQFPELDNVIRNLNYIKEEIQQWII
ncbi:TPA: tyrosine-type recombinase/integrase [Bacillus cereus]|uniref:tyrosine-type recombinase/integrase n=1 Tax=Bacillus cereus TaxID=1396 RepID=UPI000BF94EFA|nr:tyrosine-type recombinase/integrase [Bacillus cereus]PFS49684.1 hypothetical protein COK44_07540 [Bacillus cereus]